MIRSENVRISGSEYEYLRMDMGDAPLIVLKGSTGYVMCGYLNLDAANKLGDCAVRVTGVNNLESVLESTAVGVSDEARKLGILEGQKVSDIIKFL